MTILTVVTATPVTKPMVVAFVSEHPNGRLTDDDSCGYIEFPERSCVVINTDPGLWPYDDEDLVEIEEKLGEYPSASIEIHALTSLPGSYVLAREVAVAMISLWGGMIDEDTSQAVPLP